MLQPVWCLARTCAPHSPGPRRPAESETCYARCRAQYLGRDGLPTLWCCCSGSALYHHPLPNPIRVGTFTRPSRRVRISTVTLLSSPFLLLFSSPSHIPYMLSRYPRRPFSDDDIQAHPAIHALLITRSLWISLRRPNHHTAITSSKTASPDPEISLFTPRCSPLLRPHH